MCFHSSMIYEYMYLFPGYLTLKWNNLEWFPPLSPFSRRQKVCCGIIYKGRFGEVLIDTHLFKPCCSNKKATAEKPELQAPQSPTISNQEEWWFPQLTAGGVDGTSCSLKMLESQPLLILEACYAAKRLIFLLNSLRFFFYCFSPLIQNPVHLSSEKTVNILRCAKIPCWAECCCMSSLFSLFLLTAFLHMNDHEVGKICM